VKGDKRLNGVKYDQHTIKDVGGYVMQDDVLNGYLTVEETLTYAARLRLQRGTSSKVEITKLLSLTIPRE
jgi:ABC-type multidrug transport system ATPase subunit